MKEKFIALWNACKDLPPTKDGKSQSASRFAATKGKNYDQNNVKLLVIGRAPNGRKLMDEKHSTPEKMAEWAYDRLYRNAECGG